LVMAECKVVLSVWLPTLVTDNLAFSEQVGEDMV
jgi:hypothetical protein